MRMKEWGWSCPPLLPTPRPLAQEPPSLREGTTAAGGGASAGRGLRLRHKAAVRRLLRSPRAASPSFRRRARPSPCTPLAAPWLRSPGTRNSRSCSNGTASTAPSSSCVTFSTATRNGSTTSGERRVGWSPCGVRGPGQARELSLMSPWSGWVPRGSPQGWNGAHVGGGWGGASAASCVDSSAGFPLLPALPLR